MKKRLNHHHVATLFLAFLFFGALFLGTHMIISGIERRQLSALTTALHAGLQVDLEHLVREGNAAAESPAIKRSLISRDVSVLRATLIGEKNARSIGLMGVADSEGYIIARTRTASKTGDRVSVINPQGRALARGVKNTASIEVSSFDPHQVIMTTGRNIYDGGNMIGSLYASYLLDDEYAARFAHDRLSNNRTGADVMFYTLYHGAYGSSFRGPLKDDVNLYLDSESDFMRSNKTEISMRINGIDYLVRRVPFQGLESSDTGALVFLPIFSFIRKNVIAALIGLVVLLSYVLIRHIVQTNRKK